MMFCLTCALSSQFPECPMDNGPEPVNDAGSSVNNYRYKKVVTKNITANYKKAPVNTMDTVNTKAKIMASKLELDD